MTKSEAITILQRNRDILGQYGGEEAEALDLAIQALESQPCELSDDEINAFVDGMKNVRPVVESHKWIPCSERLPEEFQRVIVTTSTRTDVCTYLKGSAYWKSYVIAWMPLPEPYKAESEDKE